MRWLSWAGVSGKYMLVLAIIVAAPVAYYLYGIWHRLNYTPPNPQKVVEIVEKVERIKKEPSRLLMVDDDLYDFDSGELIFANWLNGTVPVKVFWEKERKTALAQYEKAFVRYSLEGKRLATLERDFPFVISSDYKRTVYAKDKDLWRADIDWNTLTFTNEKRITSIQSFNDNFFAANVMLGTDKTLVVRVMPNLLRVNLETGDVHPAAVPLRDIGKRRSPNGQYVVGLQNERFSCYDVDADSEKSVNIGRGAINDFQWLDDDRCLAIAAGKTVVLYDRKDNSLTEVTPLPFFCTNLAEPSPGGHYVFCVGRGSGVIVDVKGKTATQLTGGSGVCWVGLDTFAFSRDVPNSDFRGSWFQKPDGKEWRVSTNPFLVTRAGALFVQIQPANSIVYATSAGLSKMNKDGTEVKEWLKLDRVPQRLFVPEERFW